MTRFSPRAALALTLVLPLSCGSSDDGSGAGALSPAPDAPSGSSGSDGTTAPPDTRPTCGQAGVKGGYAGQKSLTVNGAKRTYALYLPDGYDGKTTYPVVLVFHGDGGTGASLRSYFKIEQASKGQAIVAYPDGLGTTWSIDDAGGLTRDIAFSDALFAQIQSTYCADASRLFAVGFSRGAYFANQLACRTKTKLRGVVTHSGGGPFGVDDSEYDSNGDLICPSAPVPALQVQGDSDGQVPLDEGEKARDYWRRANLCRPTTAAFGPSPCVAYDGCKRAEVWCEIPGMGHTIWPQNGANVTWEFIASLR